MRMSSAKATLYIVEALIHTKT